MNNNKLPLWLAVLALAGSAHAAELVYTPVNPSFGGNALNGTWLLNNAQSQNDYDDPDATNRSAASRQSALQRFTSTLESRLLSQLLSNVEDGNTGSLTTDDFIINMIDDSGQLTIMITDRATGDISEVIIDGLLP